MGTGSVAIIVPCYNTGRFLRESLRSVLEQSRTPAEVVLVDDGSTDDTAAIAGLFPAVRYVHQPNQGVSVARNRGLSETRSEFVVFHDADDRLLPDAVAVGVGALEALPDCGFVYGFSRVINARGEVLAGEVNGRPADGGRRIEHASYETLLEGSGVVPSGAACFRRSAVEKVGGYKPGLRRAQDHELYLRIAREFSIHCHNEIVVEYRNHEGNTTHNSTAAMLKSVFDIIESQRDWIASRPELREAARRGKHHWATILGPALAGEVVGSAKRGRLQQAVLAARMLLLYHPLGVMEWVAEHLRDSSVG